MILRFRRLSIRKKLTAVTLLTSIIALMLASGTMLIYQLFDWRRTMIRELSTDAEIVAENSSAAVAFQDQTAAQSTLGALRAHPDITYAVLYNLSGTAFAEYKRDSDCSKKLLRLTPQADGNRFESGYFMVFRSVRLGSDRVGSITLVSDLREQKSRMIISAVIMLSALIAAVIISLVISLQLQRIISDPLLSLADLTRRITEEKDYSLRATVDSQDEMGILVQGINRMLSEIQKRDMELRASEERFRQLAETIREVFWMVDVENGQVVYVSPSYDQVWGRSAIALYENREDWMTAIHPDDRERVRAACAKQISNQYDEEYRIIRPDGSLRWIHDRAFTIADEKGRIYRLVGIAEDITDRRQLQKQLLEISDREQSRMGQDLHDGLSQYLVRIGFAANVLLQELDQQSHPERIRAKTIAELIDRTITQARNLARGLYPVKLETEGLYSGLEELATSVQAEHHINCEVTCMGNFEIKEYAVAIHLYRIAQEAVINSVKHAQANNIFISLCRADATLIMSISDNGIGLQKTGGGMGLHIMNYRARMIGATLDITDRSGQGTLITCILQLQSQGRSEIEEKHKTV